MVAEVTVLKDLQGALEQQRMSLEALHRRQSELSEENAALRECLESLGILCGQAFLSRLHRRRLERVLSRHPMSQTQATLEVGLGRRAESQKGDATAAGGPKNVRAGSDRGQLQRAGFVVSLLSYGFWPDLLWRFESPGPFLVLEAFVLPIAGSYSRDMGKHARAWSLNPISLHRFTVPKF
ncbi:unnamed protein product [Symbiodinium sp. CCMP2456]|nr:unnamed protein product [Symbiodinium sp. CCMP2456]